MRTLSLRTLLLALPLSISASLLSPAGATAQAMQDRPSPGASTRPVEEAPVVESRLSLRGRIAEAIASLRAAGRTVTSAQRAESRRAPVAWTRRTVR